MSGKGSKPRPFSVDQETYASNWDAIFKPAAPSSNSRAPTSNVEGLRANRSGAANREPIHIYPNGNGLWCTGGEHVVAKCEGALITERYPCNCHIYINPETGEQVTEDWWPTIQEPSV